MSSDEESISHIAGVPVGIEGRYVQRCGWCGFKLVDVEMIEGPYYKNGLRPPLVEPGALVRRWPDGALQVIEKKVTGKLPEDNCEGLVE